MEDLEFAKKCESIFRKGSEWVDNNLYNGEYYEHKITDPLTFQYLDMRNPDLKIPPYQLGSGCLVDQLVGQYMSHVCNLGYLAKKENVQNAMNSVMKNNFVNAFGNSFNNMRSYGMGDESGLIMASWPKGRLAVPFPYFAETMTGFEYAAAIGMLYEGQIENGLKCIKSIRDRFDGEKRNPYDEPECGHHYARAMASWSSILALSGFKYNANEKSMEFTATPGMYFWSNGYAWGTCKIKGNTASFTVLQGKIELNKFSIHGKGHKVLQNEKLSFGGNNTISILVK
jgi:uncharacterized protein (DUF608 family)